MKSTLFKLLNDTKVHIRIAFLVGIVVNFTHLEASQAQTKATIGTPINKTAKVIVTEMDFIDGVDAAGANTDNNFDIRTDPSTKLVPDGEPEWALSRNANGLSTIYIKDSRIRANVKLKCEELANKTANLALCSTGDLNFTPEGLEGTTVSVTFDANGLSTKTFTTTNKVTAVLDLKDYKINWQGNALGCNVIQSIYTLYDKPYDPLNGPAPDDEPFDWHLQYVLGPATDIQPDTGAWVNGGSTLHTDDIPTKIRNGIRKDGTFQSGSASSGNPWIVVADPAGGPCEAWSQLMKYSLLLLGIPDSKISRKSVVVLPATERPTWLGGPALKVVKGFKIENGSEWINEGVCGVLTDDDPAQPKWKYFDIAGSRSIGDNEGWLHPTEYQTGKNLWYVPQPAPAEQHGPIIYSIIPDVYGYWSSTLPPAAPDQTLPAWTSSPEVHRSFPPQLALTNLQLNGNIYTLTYRTEGLKNAATDVYFEFYTIAENGEATLFNGIVIPAKKIDDEWNNMQSVTFQKPDAGKYAVVAKAKGQDLIVRPQWSAQAVFVVQ